MKRLRIAFAALTMLLGSYVLSAQNFIVATDFFTTDGTTDVADQLQKVIDDNPNRTIYIPDGTYILSHPICTSADPAESVHLVLGNYAILKASAAWPEDAGAIIRCGAKKHFNTIYVDGSNYGIEGGIIDGNDVADGISIESGRETRLSRISIKHTKIGVHILFGANSGSSDSDITDVNIVGTGKSNSIGVLVEGHDNTFTDMRIAKVHVGVWLKSGGNSLRNIHPLFIMSDGDYETSCGFRVDSDNNFMNFCYSDQFATGFKIAAGKTILMTDCFAWWYSGKVPFQTVIDCDGPFDSFINGIRAVFSKECPKATFLKAAEGGKGFVSAVAVKREGLSSDDVTAKYIKN